MKTEEKVNAILDAWMQFIRLEDLSAVKVTGNDARELKGIKLNNDTLYIEKPTFTKLHDKLLLSSREQQETIWALSFPQIYTVYRGKPELYPLFWLNATPLLKGEYQAEGWEIENLEIAETGDHLVNFFDIEEEQIQELITKEGLYQFLHKTFGFDFISFEDWMKRIKLSRAKLPGCRIDAHPYLFEFKGSNFYVKLKQDFTEIRESSKKFWLRQGNPAWNYLSHIPARSPDSVMYLGAFPTYIPTDSQLEALKHAQSYSLTAVQGPPGSGKTTLILHLIAQQVVTHALRLIETDEEKNTLTVVSSTVNKAVENVIERLKEGLKDPDLHKEIFYLNGGSQKNITRPDGAKAQLQEACGFLRQTPFEVDKWQSLKDEISQLKTLLLEKENAYKRLLEQKQNDETHQTKLKQEIQLLNQQRRELEGTRAHLLESINSLSSYIEFPNAAYEQIQFYFGNAQNALPDEPLPWWKHLWCWIRGNTEEKILNRMALGCQSAIQQIRGTPFELQLPRDRCTLHEQSRRIERRLKNFQNFKLLSKYQAENEDALFHNYKQYVEHRIELNSMQNKLNTPLENFYKTFHIDFHEENQKLFELSRKFLLQEALKRKDEVDLTLRLYSNILGSDRGTWFQSKKEFEQNIDKYLQAISLLFPVITSSLHSIRSMLPWVTECVDRVIVDEAGMIPLHQTFPLLVRTRKAIVVGDPLQIEPVISQRTKAIQDYYQKAFVERGLTYEEYCRYAPNVIDRATTYHRAAGANGKEGNIGRGIQLIEHRRCQEPIIEFCKRIAGYKLIPLTEPANSLLGTHLVAYHVDGKGNYKENLEEIDAVSEVIKHLLKHGYTLKDIGVISFFRAQATALKDSLLERFPDLRDSIGTVHKFQGSQRKVIILSTKVFQHQDDVTWISQKVNLLNVAVSRAEELFVLVGNLYHLEKGKYTRELVEYIRNRGIILEYKSEAATTILSKYSTSPDSKIIPDCCHINLFEEVLQTVQKELHIVVPQIGGSAARQFIKEVPALLNREVEVTIVYDSRESSATQDEIIDNKDLQSLKELFSRYSNARLIPAGGGGTNQRILVCDRQFAVVGSWNWLSHFYLEACRNCLITPEVQIRPETSVRLSDAELIQSIMVTIQQLIQNSSNM